MTDPASYKGILKKYESCTEDVKFFFEHLPNLIQNCPYEVNLAYIFLQTEKAQNRTIYCGVVKLHRAHAEIASNIINSHHMTREGFLELYKNIFGSQLPKETTSLIKEAERIRDKVIHGKNVSDANIRRAISDVLDYAESMNKELDKTAGFKPFGDLRGFKGRGTPLDKSTTKWLLSGIGLGSYKKNDVSLNCETVIIRPNEPLHSTGTRA